MNKSTVRDPSLLEERISYKFKDPSILKEALTHSSYANEAGSRGEELTCNERLEFLGDSVLSIVTSEYLFKNYPTLPEGKMSTVRSGAVCEKSLAVFASDIELGEYILLGQGEKNSDGKSRPSILADAFEALLAAVFLDGGIAPVKKFLLPYITETITEEIKSNSGVDAKTKLQQIVQCESGEILSYEVINEEGPSHDRTFTIEARLNSNVIGVGTGKSKRAAEQAAAEQALSYFGETI